MQPKPNNQYEKKTLPNLERERCKHCSNVLSKRDIERYVDECAKCHADIADEYFNEREF